MSKLIFEIPAELCNIKTAVIKVVKHLKNIIPICDEEIFDIRVILNELIINSIQHSEANDENIRIICGISEKKFLYLIIEDRGCGYNKEEVIICSSSIEGKINEMKESGRGLLIVRGLCDKLKTNRKGNKVVVLKKLKIV
jgi:serine/threonine-protein kinase RsbW